MPDRDLAVELYRTAVAGAATGPVTQRAIDALHLDRDRRIRLLAFGKAARAMTAAAAAALERSLHPAIAGIMVTPDGEPSPCPTVVSVRGDHPIPGRHSFDAAARIGELAAGRRSTDANVVLVSGGTSSLIAAPLRGMREADLSHVFELLLASGLDITAMNAVRKRFSRWGGGRLALALAPAATYCLAVSDVPGDDPATIGSGPCTPDPFTVHAVTDILRRAKLYDRLPPAFRAHLTDTMRGMVPETPKATHPAFAHVVTRVIATNRLALDAAAERGRELGAEVDVVEDRLVGEAWARGEQIAHELLALRAGRAGGAARPLCRVWGGETTVNLERRGGSGEPLAVHGGASDGGRCQELALAAARVLAAAGERACGITLLAAGTDGRDGPTDAAGACIDAGTWRAVCDHGIDPELALTTHDSYAALDAAGALVRTGPTGTNVMDVVVGIVR